MWLPEAESALRASQVVKTQHNLAAEKPEGNVQTTMAFLKCELGDFLLSRNADFPGRYWKSKRYAGTVDQSSVGHFS